MTAGMIKVPTIVPLRPPSNSRKNMIDTRTPVEVFSETPGALIYYTVNGTKPDPFKKIGEKFTYRYYKPFLLGSGKRTVKAMATSSDGTRESSIVTKMFLVEDVELNRSEDDGGEDGEEVPSSLSKSIRNLDLNHSQASLMQEQSRNGWSGHDYQGKKSDASTAGLPYRKSKPETRFGRREEVQSPEYLGLLLDRSQETTFQRSRTPTENEFMKCIYCFAPRPSDPYSTFCNDCGSPLPQLPTSTLPPPHADRLGMCKICRSMVPLNAPTCVVCEAAMGPQRLPQGSPRMPDQLVCDICDTVNPPDMTRCVSCESKLPLKSKQIPSGVSAPPLPKNVESLITCSNCLRVNSGEARFCDWCGSKPVPYTSYLTCSKCKGSNQPYSKYCSSCACHIEPPPRVNSSSSMNGVLGTIVEKEKLPQKVSSSNLTTWIPVDVPRMSGDIVHQATQTGGLFYPSSTAIGKQHKLEADERARTENLRDRRPTLAAVSPGRGYWRQQMDHICSHLRAHAQNHPDFRALIGEPRIGKLVATTVHEDFEGEELTLTVTFTRRKTDNSDSNSKLRGKDATNNIRSIRTGNKVDLEESSSSVGSSGNSAKKKTPKRSNKKKTIGNKSKENNLSSETRLLFKELGKAGEGSPEEVERLISEEADVNGENIDGVRVLTMAVLNNHVDCVPLLVNQGAELNHQSASNGNTALHEAVILGPTGRQCVEVLLGCGADTMLTNKAGESPYDLAVKSGNDNIIEKFTTNLGQGLLAKLTKSKSG